MIPSKATQTSGDAGRPPGARGRGLNLALAGLGSAAVLTWLLLVAQNRASPDFWQRDWYCFWSVGSSFLTDSAAGLYSRPCAPGYYWLYPPYMIYPWAALAMLPAGLAYGVVLLVQGCAFVAALALLKRTLVWQRPFGTLALAAIASAAFNATLVTGQHAPILLLGSAGAVWSLKRGRDFQAGLFIALLGIKPNWVIFFVLWLCLTRRWRTLATTALAGGVLVASTLPMGTDVWREYLSSGADGLAVLLGLETGAGDYFAWKLVTADAFVRSLTEGADPLVRLTLTLGSLAFALTASVLVWLRAPEVEVQVAVVVLATVAANVYVEFYDALVLVLPAAIWWRSPRRYPTPWGSVVGSAIVAVWTLQWLSLYVLRVDGQPSLVGGILLVWIAAEARCTPWRARPVTARPGHSAGP